MAWSCKTSKHSGIKMTWITPDKIFEVLRDKKMRTSEIISSLEDIGHFESYRSISGHLRKLTERQQLNRERTGREFAYYNPVMYKGE